MPRRIRECFAMEETVMNKTINTDLVDASDITEHLIKRLPGMSLEDKIDVAARLRAVVKNCGIIDDVIKTEIKTKLKNKDGLVMGDMFKARLAFNPVSRLNQASLKEAHPDIVEEFTEIKPEGRVTFEPR